jgi:hypothetical protein
VKGGQCVPVGRGCDPLSAHAAHKDPTLTGSECVKNKRPVFADEGGNRWHPGTCRVSSCKSEGGAVHELSVGDRFRGA